MYVYSKQAQPELAYSEYPSPRLTILPLVPGFGHANPSPIPGLDIRGSL